MLLDSTRVDSPITAGLAQRHAREMDALCSPVCSSSNFVQEYPLSYNNSHYDNDDDYSETDDDSEDSEDAMERAYHECE